MKPDSSGVVRKTFFVFLVILLLILAYDQFDDMRMAREISQRKQQANSSLYDRLGGRPAIEAVTDDFLGQLVKEPRFQKQFAGAPPELLKKVRNHVVDQLCEATGGPCKYTGRDMRAIHKGMGIHEEDWNVTVGLLQNSLDKFHVPPREQEELKAIIATTKAGIVE